MRPLALAACALLAGLPIQAQTRASCSFHTECAEGEDCSPTDFSVELATDGERATLGSDAQTIDGIMSVSPGGASYFFAATTHGLHLLTIVGDGAPVHYTVHVTDPGLVLTYIGGCEDIT